MAKVLGVKGTAGSETSDPWDPSTDTFMAGTSTVTPGYTVDPSIAANTVTSFKTIQAAISQAAIDQVASGLTTRIYIQVKPGTYAELVYIPAIAAPITLYGTSSDASLTKVRAVIDQGMTGATYTTNFSGQFSSVQSLITAMYTSLNAKATLGTSGSAMVWVKNNGFQAKNITFENGYNEDRTDSASNCLNSNCVPANAAGQWSKGNHQAVALMVDGADKVQFENVRFVGNQDTLYLKSSTVGTTVRSYFNNSYVEGDVDFIFGRATAYFNKSTIKSLGARTTLSYATAPSTNYNTSYGFVFNDCDFVSDGYAAAGSFNLARQWFEGQKCSPYGDSKATCVVDTTNTVTESTTAIRLSTVETVGKTIILNSRIGAHINGTSPWADWSSTSSATNYRLVTLSSDDYWDKLVAAGKTPATYYPATGVKKSPVDPFLAEYNDVSN